MHLPRKHLIEHVYIRFCWLAERIDRRLKNPEDTIDPIQINKTVLSMCHVRLIEAEAIYIISLDTFIQKSSSTLLEINDTQTCYCPFKTFDLLY